MTVANIITLVRIALVPIFMACALLGSKTDANFLALTIFVIASLTDSLDGYIARKYKQITTFGKFIDPLADKLLVTSALLVFVEMGIMPAWAVMIILTREFAVTSLRMVAAAGGIVIQAAFWGKIKTLVQIIGIIALLLGLGSYEIILGITVQNIAVVAMVAVAVISGIDYIVRNIEIIKDGMTQGGKKK